MADAQVKPPHALSPYPYGLLSVANITYHNDDDRWARWTAHQYDSDSFALRLMRGAPGLDIEASNGELFDGRSNPRYLEYQPFAIEVEDFASTFSLPAQNRFERVKRILECATSRAVERELWEGIAAQDTDGFPSDTYNHYFRMSGATRTAGGLPDPNAPGRGGRGAASRSATDVTVAAGGDPPRVALARLEGALADCPTGQRGTIHMTRRMGSLLSEYIDRIDYSEPLDTGAAVAKRQMLVTYTGTPVVVGPGYTGNGPEDAAGDAAITDTTEWMFATGYVDVDLGEITVFNEDLARSITATNNTNDVRIKAVRTAAVHFEPCCFYAVRVDYSATV